MLPQYSRLGPDGRKFGQMAKNCMKITKSTFWWQNGRRYGEGQARFCGNERIPSFLPPTRETLRTSSPVRAEVDMLHHAQLQVAVL